MSVVPFHSRFPYLEAMAVTIIFDFVHNQASIKGPDGVERPVREPLVLGGTSVPPSKRFDD